MEGTQRSSFYLCASSCLLSHTHTHACARAQTHNDIITPRNLLSLGPPLGLALALTCTTEKKKKKDCLLLKTEVTSVTTINKDGEENEDKSLTGCEDKIDGCPRVRLKLADGGEILAYAAVIATEAPAAVGLLGDGVLEGGARPSRGRSSTCLYFAIDGPAPVNCKARFLMTICAGHA